MSALICGSLAFDTIMVFPDRFRHHILPDKLHMLNVAFLVPELRREFGGCAGNIAYNLRLLGAPGYPMGTVGQDFGPYYERLQTLGISDRYIRQISSTYTAQAYITTDLDDNQIIAFHPGAMNHAHENHVPMDADITLGIVAPDGREGMIQHACEFVEAGIPFIFDPGQGMPMFNGEELRHFIAQASYIAVNEYEAAMLQERTGLSQEQIASQVQAYITTQGSQGSIIIAQGERLQIPSVPAAQVVDPTGCGDAYRAGLIYGLLQGLDWETTGRIASLLGSLKVAQAGPQNHRFTLAEFQGAYKAAFGSTLAL
jgi:adenosine kinase